MHVSQMKVQPERLERMVAEGMISKKTHETQPYVLYDYTSQAVYKRCWNNETIASRGLVLDLDYNVVARPMPKMSNIDEVSRSDIRFKRPFLAFEKLDGSMGIGFPLVGGGFQITTRGSFDSLQGQWATSVLEERYGDWKPHPDYTYVWEIIYPSNRVVVDYGDTSDLFFLTAIHKETGANVFNFGDENDWPGPRAHAHSVNDLNPRDIKYEMEKSNAEGFVLYFPHDNSRIKVKFDEYVRLHRIATGISSVSIWRTLAAGDSFEDILSLLPDETFDWFDSIRKSLENEFNAIREVADVDFDTYSKIAQDRKHFAEMAKKTKYPDLLFALLDGKDIQRAIWDKIKPKYETPRFFDEA